MLSILLLSFVILGCDEAEKIPETSAEILAEIPSETPTDIQAERPDAPYIVVLGVAQDAGFPQSDCKKECCQAVWKDPSMRKMVSCLGLVDPVSKQTWMFDATPDFKDQLKLLQNEQIVDGKVLSGIFLTHGHIGHYTGLMNLGREAMGADHVPVYAMHRMDSFLRSDGPWSQLVTLGNIELKTMQADAPIQLNERLKVTPFIVPHRDEFTETVGYKIESEHRSVIFIPDIDKWNAWDRDILALIEENDDLFLDGTFFANGEIPGRDMSEIPHPFIEESMALFATLEKDKKSRVHFIHFNHTNPVLRQGNGQNTRISPYGLAHEGDVVSLEK